MIPSFTIMGMNKELEAMARRIQVLACTQPETEEMRQLILQLVNVCEQSCVELKAEYQTSMTYN